MAYSMKEGLMASNTLDNMLASAKGEEIIPDGALIVLGDLLTDDTYAADGVEYNAYKAGKVAALGDEVVIADMADISEGAIAGNTYKIGYKLYDLQAPAGKLFRVRRLMLHDKFWLGDSNFAAAPTVGQYAIATVGSYLHTQTDEKPAAGYGVKILAKKDLTAGTSKKGDLYLCEVISL